MDQPFGLSPQDEEEIIGVYSKGQLVGKYLRTDLNKIPFLEGILEDKDCKQINLEMPPKFLSLVMENILNEWSLPDLHKKLMKEDFTIETILYYLNYLGMESTNKKIITGITKISKISEDEEEIHKEVVEIGGKFFSTLDNPNQYLVRLSLEYAKFNIDGKEQVGKHAYGRYKNCFTGDNSITFGYCVCIPVEDYIKYEMEDCEILCKVFNF